jgi:hypothetical protein
MLVNTNVAYELAKMRVQRTLREAERARLIREAKALKQAQSQR